MSDHQIRIDITADDDASKTLDAVADDAEALEKLAPEIAVTADDDASQVLEALTADVDTLDKLSPEITITADTTAAAGDVAALVDDLDTLDRLSPTVEVTADTSAAIGDVQALADDVDTLSRQDTEILLRAKIDDAKAGLKALRDDLDETRKHADKTADELDRVGEPDRGKFTAKGNAIADLTGPLGDASGAASDFAGVFDGLADISEGVAAKVGISAENMAGAIGGIGFAVAAAAAVWTFFKQKQEEARQKQEELIKGHKEFQDLLEEAKFAEAGQQLVDMYKGAFDAAEGAKIPIQEVTNFITGLSDEMPTVTSRVDAFNRQFAEGKTGSDRFKSALEAQIGSIRDAREQYQNANGSLKTQRDRVDDVSRSLAEGYTPNVEDAADATKRMKDEADDVKDSLDKMAGALDMERAFLNFQDGMSEAMASAQDDANLTAEEILDIKDDIISVAAAAKLTPIQVKALLEKVDEGNLAYVQRQVESAWNSNKPELGATFIPPTQADVDRIKAEMRAKFGTLNVPVEAVPRTRNGSTYTGPR